MKTGMKKIVVFFLTIALLIGVICIDKSFEVRAESVTVTLYAVPQKPNKGDAVTVVISVNGTPNSEYKITVSYDTKILQFDSCRNGNASRDGSIITITGKTNTQPNLDFTAIGECKLTLLVTGVSATSAEGDNLTIDSSSMPLTVGEADPSTEQPTTAEATSGDAGIFANVKLNYDGREYTVVNDDSYTNLPEGFSPVPSSYDGDLIRGFSYGEGGVTILCLRSGDKAMSYFVYDELTKVIAPYHEFEQKGARIVVLPITDESEIPYGYQKTDYNVNEGKLPVYTQGNGDNIYLVKAAKLGSDASLYYFDPEEQVFVKFFNPKDSDTAESITEAVTEESTASDPLFEENKPIGEEDIVSYGTLKGLLIMVSILFVMAAIAIIVLLIKLSKGGSSYEEYEYDEYDDEDDDSPRNVKRGGTAAQNESYDESQSDRRETDDDHSENDNSDNDHSDGNSLMTVSPMILQSQRYFSLM